MKFGKIPQAELKTATLHLPEDHPRTQEVLKNNGKADFKAYVGCAKWGRKEWVGLIYPPGTKDKEFLSNYVKHFNAIEMNTTFYSIKKSNVEKWKEEAPTGFKFSPKMSRGISHIKRLKDDARRYTDYFLDCAFAFEDHLGTSFLQMPENFAGKYLERLYDYLKELPEDYKLCVELRHESWFNDKHIFDETFAMLEEQKTGAVITDVAGRRDVLHQRLTTPVAFIRFNGYGLHDTDYQRMDEWVARIKIWKEQGLNEVYFYAHQENEKHTPYTCDYFIKQLNEACGLDLESPEFIEQ
ncbi:MAG: DUF72 domain-containing protein [Fulvivirga sp.]|nr:DUF72 domain-containing protein [Fulvivirga sp.]